MWWTFEEIISFTGPNYWAVQYKLREIFYVSSREEAEEFCYALNAGLEFLPNSPGEVTKSWKTGSTAASNQFTLAVDAANRKKRRSK